MKIFLKVGIILIDQARLAQATKKSFFGVLGTSPVHNILCILDSLILDYMHLVLEGEFVQWLSFWLNSRDKNGFLAKQVASLEDEWVKLMILHSGFVFEAMISDVKRLFRGTQCIADQIVKNLIIAQNTNAFIENSTLSGSNEELCNFA
jgi:hypothetical protein